MINKISPNSRVFSAGDEWSEADTVVYRQIFTETYSHNFTLGDIYLKFYPKEHKVRAHIFTGTRGLSFLPEMGVGAQFFGALLVDTQTMINYIVRKGYVNLLGVLDAEFDYNYGETITNNGIPAIKPKQYASHCSSIGFKRI